MKFDEVSWELSFREAYYRDGLGWPVEYIYIPATFTSPIVRVSCQSDTARNSWRAAGDIIQIIEDSQPDFEGQSIAIPLNVIKLLEFSPTVEKYSLKFSPKPWIDSFELKIEFPSGGG